MGEYLATTSRLRHTPVTTYADSTYDAEDVAPDEPPARAALPAVPPFWEILLRLCIVGKLFVALCVILAGIGGAWAVWQLWEGEARGSGHWLAVCWAVLALQAALRIAIVAFNWAVVMPLHAHLAIPPGIAAVWA